MEENVTEGCGNVWGSQRNRKCYRGLWECVGVTEEPAASVTTFVDSGCYSHKHCSLVTTLTELSRFQSTHLTRLIGPRPRFAIC